MTLSTLQSPMQRNALLMYIALATPGNHILVLHAKNGVGKTSLWKQVALALGVTEDRVVRWSLGQHGPENLNGWPVPGDDGMHFVMPAAIGRLNDGEPALFVLDEIGDAPRSVQAACHRLLDARELGDDRAKPSLKIVGAMNPPEYATDAQETGFGFANRCIFVPFETPSKPDFTRYRLRRGEPQRFDFPVIEPEALDHAQSYINGVATAYFGTEDAPGNPQAVLEEDPKQDDVAARWPMCFATPRSWDYALNLAATCIAVGDQSAMHKLMAGTIGEPQALAFTAFEAEQDLIPGLEAAKDPARFTPDRKRPDRTFAQLMVVAEAVTSKRIEKKDAATWWNRGWAFIEHCRAFGGTPWAEVSKGFALVAASHLGENMPTSGALLAEHEDIIRELAPLVAASRA